LSRAQFRTWSISAPSEYLPAHIARIDSTALLWQWSGGDGTRNGVGDFDQIDGLRTPA